MKRLLSLVLVFAMIFCLSACAGKNDHERKKIGVITGPSAQSGEEYRAAEKLQKKYGGEAVVTATFSEDFSSDQEKVVSTVTEMASDKNIKVIVIVPAVQGTADAIDKVRETRDDIVFICGVCAEDPFYIAERADICMLIDEVVMGESAVDQAYKQGAKTFVHISFPRHLEYPHVSARRDLIMKRCQELGIRYVEATAPDPAGENGVTEAKKWISENVPKYVEEYGKDTAFFATNCSMQATLIRKVAELGAILPQQCCPSPYHGYPEALGIDISGHEGDVSYILGEIATKIAEYGNSGRMSTWQVPVNMVMVEAAVEYAIQWCDRPEDSTYNEEVLLDKIKTAGGDGTTITKYTDEAIGTLDNFYLIRCPYYDL